MKAKKILLIGERSLSQNEYAYADSFYDILMSFGHQVVSVDPTQTPWWLGARRSFGISGIEHKLFEIWFNAKVIDLVLQYNPDVFFVLKGHILQPKTLEIIKQKTHAKCVLLYPDNPFMFTNGNSNVRVVQSLALYDVILSWAQMLQPVFTSIGAVHSCYFPFGYDDRFFSKKTTSRSLFDIGFVGTADDERAHLLEQLVLRGERLRIGIWGNRWSEYFAAKPVLKRIYQGPAVYKERMVALLKSSKITLNPVRLQNYTSHNMRSLEAAAAGVFQLATRTREHENVLFRENESIALYASVGELVEKASWFVDRPARRDYIAQQAQEAVHAYSLQRMLARFIDRDCCFC